MKTVLFKNILRLTLATAMVALAGCKVAVIVVEGGEVQAEASGTCTAGTICITQVNDTTYKETFTAVADSGWEFVRWNKAGGSLCGNRTNPSCKLDATKAAGKAAIEAIIASPRTYYLMPVFQLASGAAQITVQSTVLSVSGEQPEGVTVGDVMTFTTTIPVQDAQLLLEGTSCADGYVNCSQKAWSFPAADYEKSYSSGYVESGTITQITISDGGSLGVDATNLGADRLSFASNTESDIQSFELYAGDGEKFTGPPADLDAGLAGLDQGFDTASDFSQTPTWVISSDILSVTKAP